MNKEELKKKLQYSFIEEFEADASSIKAAIQGLRSARERDTWRECLATAELYFHKLRGASRTAGLSEFHGIIQRLHTISKSFLDEKSPSDNFPIDAIQEAIETLAAMAFSLRANGVVDTTVHEPTLRSLGNALSDIQKQEVDKAESKTETNPASASGESGATEGAPYTLSGNPRILDVYLVELEDAIKSINKSLGDLENAKDDLQAHTNELNKLYRVAHTLKGASRGLGATPLVEIFHRLEEAFDRQTAEVSLVGVEDLRILYAIARKLALIKGRFDAKRAVEVELTASTVDCADALFQGPMFQGTMSKGTTGIVSGDGRIGGQSESTGASSQVIEAENETDSVPSAPLKNAPDALTDIDMDAYLPASSFVRVDAKKLDRLLDQSGELKLVWQRMGDWQSTLQSLSSSIRDVRDSDDLSKGIYKKLRLLEGELEKSISSFQYGSRNINQVMQAMEHEVKFVRMQRFEEACLTLNSVVHDFSERSGREFDLAIRGGEVEIDRTVIEGIKAPLLHLIRNGMDHGIEDASERESMKKPKRGQIKVSATLRGQSVEVRVEDDGRGIDVDAVLNKAKDRGIDYKSSSSSPLDLIFSPGFSTASMITDISGRGIGLDVVKRSVESLHGNIKVHSEPGTGTTFTLNLPMTLSSLPALTIISCGQTFVIATSSISKILRITPEDIRTFEGKATIDIEGVPVPAVSLQDCLRLPDNSDVDRDSIVFGLVASSGDKRLVLVVDKIVNDTELVIKAMPKRLSALDHVAAATILPSGRAALILNAPHLIERGASQESTLGRLRSTTTVGRTAKKKILLAEDSATTRTLEKSVLEGAGYEVIDAGDGSEAWQLLQQGPVDLVVSDIEMPKMTGFEFTEVIRQSERYKDIPVVLVTGLSSDTDKKRGLEVGASAYIVKGDFDEKNLLNVIGQLI